MCNYLHTVLVRSASVSINQRFINGLERTPRIGNSGMLLASGYCMECYFSARKKNSDNTDGKSSVVMFHIPDVGIRFKAPFAGVDQDHSDLASLLALLEFIDSNQKYFSSTTFQVYGDNLSIINQVNGKSSIRREFAHLLKKTEQYREKYRFSLQWIPSRENTADDSLLD